MFSYAANISVLWADLPFLDRFDAAAEAGFKGVDVMFPYETPAQETIAALKRNKLELTSISAPPPNYTGGDRGFAAIPGREARFAYDMRRTFRYATALHVKLVHVICGKASGPSARESFISNLKQATKSAPKNVTLLLEPLSPDTMPEYFLNDVDLALDVLKEVDASNLGLSFDTAHMHALSGNAVDAFAKYAPLVRHIQISDAPGRGAPGTGEIDFDAFFEAIKAADYTGWVTAKYTCNARTDDTFEWRR